MSKNRPGFACTACGWSTTKWVGRCGECQEWGTVDESVPRASGRGTVAANVSTPALPIGEVSTDATVRRTTGVGEFDRVLGGGLVPGAVVLLAGEPGVGKSTLLLDVAAHTARTGARVLYVTGEESASQVRLRGERIGALADTLYLAAETDLGRLLGHVDAINPDVLIVDSVQTFASGQVDGAAGGVAQVREVAAAVIAVAKSRGLPAVLVGHVTKDGTIAGPRVLEHLVDVVCQFEGDRHAQLRMVRAVKNRYGATDEVGCFVLDDDGIHSLADPSGLFLSTTRSGVNGSCVTVTLDGRRPLTTEIQSLVTATDGNHPRRATQGVDSSRVSMILAVLSAKAKTSTANCDVYVSCVGGARAGEPAADLAIALAAFGSISNRSISTTTIAIGEVSLTGDLRPVLGLSQRLGEAARLGFTRAIIPGGNERLKTPAGMEVIPVPDLVSAIRMVFPRST